MFVEEEYYINLYVGSTIDMLNYWVKHKEIDLYVEHEIDTTFFVADNLLLTATSIEGSGDGNQGGEGGEGLNGEGVEVVGSKSGEVEIDEGGEGVEGLNREGVDVDGSKDGEDAGGLNSGVEEANEERFEDESDSDLQKENVYLMKIQAEVPEEVEGEGLNDRVARKEEGNGIEYFDSDDYGSILGSNDDGNNDAYRRISRFPTYNPDLASSHFCIGMLFKDGE
ncbi:hypothetical protein PVK06_030731 [Gossypium arboreum]|uniref:Uncharacterized protein n=1 Tax=Gossypium arboreum TaxID=29729 RepID=A0ABR0NP30_GOSAR|nr:hypothetical protein PVK06_030731 [Gossypium arboreum]